MSDIKSLDSATEPWRAIMDLKEVIAGLRAEIQSNGECIRSRDETIQTLRDKVDRLEVVRSAAVRVVGFNWGMWGMSTSEAYHFERVAAMDQLRKAVSK